MNKSSSITNEILTIVVAITTVVCFFILPDKISFIVAFCSGVYILYSFYIEVQNKSSIEKEHWMYPLILSGLSFFIGNLLDGVVIFKICMFITIVMLGRCVLNFIYAMNKDIYNRLQQEIDTTSSLIRSEITFAEQQIKTSMVSTEELNNIVLSIQNRAKLRIQDMTEQLNQKDVNLKQQQLAINKIRTDAQKEIEAYKQRILEQNKIITNMRAEQGDFIRRLQEQNEQDNYPLENREIRNKFDEALKSAEKEIDIFCPWISPKVVDETMKDKFRRLLEKKVVIKIRYGIGNLSNGNNTNRNDKTQQYAQELQKEFKMYPNFKMLLDNSHAKLFICDDKFYVISSFNILSFKGDYDGQDMRRELGEYSTNKQILERYRKQYFDF
ncbi:phospholipase D-like domain-containing protein [Megamonas hypermegale]|uniref:phospholipase D-like domain-containing protein n=1 Tax=Megamonas hypermegale TaxID=158847 RepID=UPI00195B52F3|nr:phospholipase D-like domain-containing protein [Megamonas hypermegale]MBM6761861.1 hypothetical protein [Megamonas hypermegale]